MNWLEDLENKVRAAIAELERLRDDNARLAGRIEELEEKLRAARAAEDWSEERDEVRQRVEKLAKGLETLLEG